MKISELLRSAAAVRGVQAISLLGLDGMAVETLMTGDLQGDLAVWELELADLMRATRTTTGTLGWSATSDLMLEAGDMTVLARPVGREFFLLMLVSSNSNIARASYELRRAAALLSETS